MADRRLPVFASDVVGDRGTPSRRHSDEVALLRGAARDARSNVRQADALHARDDRKERPRHVGDHRHRKVGGSEAAAPDVACRNK